MPLKVPVVTYKLNIRRENIHRLGETGPVIFQETAY